MKNLLPFLFLFWFSAAVGQPIDSCDEVNSDYAIRRIYQGVLDRRIEALEVFTFYFTNEISNSEEFTKWSKSEGYTTIVDSVWGKSITIFKMKSQPSLAYYTSVYKSIINKKNELGITDCVYPSYRFTDEPINRACNDMYVESVFNKYYDRSLKNNITSSDTMKFRFTVNLTKAAKLKEWVKANDFTLKPDNEVYDGNDPKTQYVDVSFTIQLREPLYIFFSGTLRKVARMREELEIQHCGDYYVSYTPR